MKTLQNIDWKEFFDDLSKEVQIVQNKIKSGECKFVKPKEVKLDILREVISELYGKTDIQ